MSTARAVAANTGIRLISFAISKVILLAVTVYLARYLGVEGFGQYAFIISYIAFFQVITEPGLGAVLLKQLGWPDRQRAARALGNAMVIKLVLATVAMVVCWTIAWLADFPAPIAQAATIASFALFAGLTDSLGGIFAASLQQHFLALAEVSEQVVAAAGIVAAIHFDAGLPGVFAAVVVGSFVRLGIAWWFSRRFVPIRLAWDPVLTRELLLQSWPLALNVLLGTALGNLDVVMLQNFGSEAAVGVYAAGKRLVMPLTLLPGTYVSVYYPIMLQHLAEADTERFRRTLRISLKVLLAALVPIATALTFLAEPVARLVYGAQFGATADSLRVLAWFPALLAIQLLGDYVLIALGRQRLTAVFAVSRLAALALAGWVLIPRYAHTGAAIALVGSIGLFLPLIALVPETRHYARAAVLEGARVLLASAVGIVPVVYAAGFRWHWLLVATLPLYLVALILTRSVTAYEWRAAKAMLRPAGS